MKIKILYEDTDILVIDKPSGVSVHPAGGRGDEVSGTEKEETISDWFIKKYPEAKDVGEPMFSDGKEVRKPGIVHRLDRETSGVLLLTKNQHAYEFLKKQFSAPALELKTESGLANGQNRVKKTYLSVVHGWMKKDHGVINKPIGRSPRESGRRLAGRGARGKLREAITGYKVLKRFSRGPENFSLLEVYPRTGRTHQIRVHLKYLNHPVVGDRLYGSGTQNAADSPRLALHAKSIEFITPGGEKIKIESRLLEEFKKFFNIDIN